MDESFVFLPPRFGEASILSTRFPHPNNLFDSAREKNISESRLYGTGSVLMTNSAAMGESMIGVAHSEASKNVRVATRLASHRYNKVHVGCVRIRRDGDLITTN